MSEPDYLQEQEATKKSLIKIFQAVRAGNVTDLAPYILYKGNDKTRSLKVLADINNPDDLAYLQRISNRIVRYGEGSDGYSFSLFYSEDDADGKWFVWETIFNKGADRKICYFRFLLVGKIIALGDIDV